MSHQLTLARFARHELALAWRDWLSLMTVGKRHREKLVLAAAAAVVGLAHLLAYAVLGPYLIAAVEIDRAVLATVSGAALLSFSLMLSQAIESVTRAFYARGDLDLILSSPASTRRLFAVRMGAIAVSTTLLAAVLAGPFVNVLVVLDGARWLAAYAVLAAMGALAAAIAIAATILLFRLLGPRRTRLVAQIVAAVVGAAFVIGVQAGAILTYGEVQRLSFLGSESVLAHLPGRDSVWWLAARAALGDGFALALLTVAGFGALAVVIRLFAADFGDHVVAAAGADMGARRRTRRPARFRARSTAAALRRKEWALLARDPWLVSQTLMQLLYLLPPALLLWVQYGARIESLLIAVPVIVMASGQLAGGLAWLAVSGEDAPDLVASAPIAPRAVIAAKIQAVLGAVALVTVPLLAAFALASPTLALVAAAGVAIAAGASTLVQIWFRGQAQRRYFRHRHTSSRIATFAEALSSILWAGTAALAAASAWIAAGALAALALLVLGAAWLIRPAGAT